MPGLTADVVTTSLENIGLSCQTRENGGRSVWSCADSQGHRAELIGSRPDKIESVSAVTPSDASIAKQFLGFVATAPFEGSEPDNARAWTEAKFGTDAEMTFGSVHYVLNHDEALGEDSLELVPQG
ncbi:MAG: hypothetical protein M3295_06910 [Chloroflexota bacterium]|nr:hypothetical protein [Chloroflexota bacterium]